MRLKTTAPSRRPVPFSSDSMRTRTIILFLLSNIFTALIVSQFNLLSAVSSGGGGGSTEPTDHPSCYAAPTTTAATTSTTMSNPHYFESLIYKYGSDKGHDDHGYTDLYQMLFDHIRLSVRNVTEVGVFAGQGMQAFYHYFPNALIHGFDVKTVPSVKQIVKDCSDRVRFQERDLLEVSPQSVGLYDETMDLVIDDATHMPVHQRRFITNLFRLVKPGGYYIIEDLPFAFSRGRDMWRDNPESFPKEVWEILSNHDTVLVDTHMGHRDWETWKQRTSGGNAKNHAEHNSYLMVVRKRYTPPPPVQIALGSRAMRSGLVLHDGENSTLL